MDGTVSYYETIDISIKTRPSGDSGKGNMFRGLSRDRDEVLSRADDVTLLNDYDEIARDAGNLPLGVYDYVIITDETFISDFQPLVDWKSERGISTTTKSVQEILVIAPTFGHLDPQLEEYFSSAHRLDLLPGC